jgi:hypothetical protein
LRARANADADGSVQRRRRSRVKSVVRCASTPRSPVMANSALLALFLVLPACVIPPRMCAAGSDCGGRASCVAGRCVAQGATVVIDSSRRLLFSPVDTAYLRRDGDADDAAVAILGSVRDEGAIVLLRFSASLLPEANVLEAYVILERATDIDGDPTPIDLRAERVVERWDGRSISWARQPRVEQIGAPATRVFPAAGPLVRLEVRGLVQRWRRRTSDDFGIAVVAEGRSATGIAFVLSPGGADHDDSVLASFAPTNTRAQPSVGEPHASSALSVGRGRGGPRLELYVK